LQFGEEMKMVATLTPATCNCEAETKPEPCISSKKLVPGAVWVTEPEVKSGSGLSTLTLREAEDAGVDSVVALIVIEWPAQIVDAGEYRPAADIGPVELVPPVKPFTDHTTGVVTPPAEALYCAVLPSLTVDGPLRETCAAICPGAPLLKTVSKNTNDMAACRLPR
jgi:hypothetical protein